MAMVNTIDLAVLLIADNIFDSFEKNLIKEFDKLEIPYLIFNNKSDIVALSEDKKKQILLETQKNCININTLTDEFLEKVTNLMRETIPKSVYVKPALLDGLIKEKDVVLLITPIDSEAPEGRMILPQVMANS